LEAGALDIDVAAIDHLLGMADLAAQGIGVSPGNAVIAATALLARPGQAQISVAVRRLGKLADDMAMGFKGPVDIPEGAGAAEARELQGCRRMALGDRAGRIHAG